MTKLTRSISTCLLVLLLVTGALADAGETHGTGLASPLPTPPAECVAPHNNNKVSPEPPYPVQEDPSLDAAYLANVLVSWLAEAIL